MQSTDKGGPPSHGTPADRRLADNKKPKPPKPAFPGAKPPFQPKPKPGKPKPKP